MERRVSSTRANLPLLDEYATHEEPALCAALAVCRSSRATRRRAADALARPFLALTGLGGRDVTGRDAMEVATGALREESSRSGSIDSDHSHASMISPPPSTPPAPLQVVIIHGGFWKERWHVNNAAHTTIAPSLARPPSEQPASSPLSYVAVEVEYRRRDAPLVRRLAVILVLIELPLHARGPNC